MSPPRIIKKYPNRRLYDSTESRYVTLQDIRRLVVNREDFIVVDKTTSEDVTRSVLLQIIADQEQHGAPVMSQDFLSQVIRSYGSTMQNLVSGYLEHGMKRSYAQVQELAFEKKIDYRTAAYAIGLKRIEQAYSERGIFP